MQARVVERVGTDEADLLLRSEEQLDPGMRSSFTEQAPHRLEHRRDGCLVVCAEDRSGCVAHDAVLDDRLDRGRRRHRVEVRAQQKRLTCGLRLQAAEHVARVRADPGTGVVLVGGEPAVAQIAQHEVGDATLLPGRARDRRELGEQIEDLRRHRGKILRGCGQQDAHASADAG